MAQHIFNLLPFDLKESLYCAICHERFAVPKVIDCGHIFCLACLEELIRQSTQGQASCPLCRVAIRLNVDNPKDYQTQNFYADLISRIISPSTSQSGTINSKCSFCRYVTKSSETETCIFCPEIFCKGCFQQHKHERTFASELLLGRLTQRVTKCSGHSDQDVQFFCQTCFLTLCKQCKKGHSSNHEVHKLEDAVLSFKKSLFDIQAKLRDYCHEASEASHDIQRIQQEFKNSIESAKQHLTEQVQEVIAYLLQKKEETLEEIGQHEKSVLKRLAMENENAETKRVRAKSMKEYANNLVKYGTEVEIIDRSKDISRDSELLKEDSIHRYGTGFRIHIKFDIKESLLELQNREIGTVKVTQTLSPWAPRKFIPTTLSGGQSVTDTAGLENIISASRWSLFQQRRSEMLSNLVNPTMHIQAYKVCGRTGYAGVVWSSNEENKSPFPKRFSSTSTVKATICIFNNQEEKIGEAEVTKLDETTSIRIALQNDGNYIVAFYPVASAQSSLEGKKVKNVQRKDDNQSVYIARYCHSDFLGGERRALPEGYVLKEHDCMFDIGSNESIIICQPKAGQQDIVVCHPTGCISPIQCSYQNILSLMETVTHDVAFVGETSDGKLYVEKYSQLGLKLCEIEIKTDSFRPTKHFFKDATFDRYGNIIVHMVVNLKDVIYLIPLSDPNIKEHLSKPEIIHKVDLMKVLPDGRIGLCDKSEVTFVTLRYLCGEPTQLEDGALR